VLEVLVGLTTPHAFLHLCTIVLPSFLFPTLAISYSFE
jgi:hypothetical protein